MRCAEAHRRSHPVIAKLRRVLALNQQRKTVNLLLQPGLQLKLPITFLVITAVFGGLIAIAISNAYRTLFLTIAAEQPTYMEGILRAQTADLLIVSGMLAVGYLLTVLAVAIVMLHRLVGPTVALRRLIEALKNGDYSARVTLRRHDAFVQLADDLNELAALLEQGDKAEASRTPPGGGFPTP
jgi:methyl-accepting chemotaxis protein